MAVHWERWKDIMKAVPFESKRLYTKYWQPPWIIQPKLDGDRCRAVFGETGQVTLYSSEANILWTVPHIKRELEELGLKNTELDGEIYKHGIPQSDIHGMVSSQRKELHDDYESLEYHIFDQVDEEMAQVARSYILEKEIFPLLKGPLHRVHSYQIEEESMIDEFLKTFMAQGFEGFILRNSRTPYLRKRSAYYMMKLKPGREDIFMITEVIEAIDQDNKPKRMVGSFTCIDPTKPEQPFKVSAGQLTHEERYNYWSMREELIGKAIKTGFQNLTSARGVPRHGVCLEVLWN